ncbi:3-hydroxyacyl-CoA dehydrogenase/enoyl-CoA hydratase family protein [Alitabrizicola rongguiensis]|uniref:3-hydroxyacyl-CoA dehydrogenase/enoyl-CoA hydratase family protein n=1 Tax=Alitabrizicola rongguiensis TaxID=2909234 RepID=UPI001F360976|nr:3-hydroxyacyl-CoA dehydrogenase/enoyl-CoA hydratase family protein [Tabrizicola rongguiensis]
MTAPSKVSTAVMAAGVAETGIRRVMVIGAGSMGSGIAAQFANAGVQVDLLDVAGSPPNSIAEGGIARQLKAGGFMAPEAARLILAGTVDSDLSRAAEADWIVEVVIENLDAKRDLFKRIEQHCRPGTPISSNTSTLRLADLTAGMGEDYVRDFVITHFFNPPRTMPLVELVAGPRTNPETVARVRRGLETILGKTVIDCFDTPGFIANRIGCYWLAMGSLEAKRLGLTVEEADAVNTALGVPKSGVFGCLDLVGLDLVPPVWGSLKHSLPKSDDLNRFDLTTDPLIARLVAEGRHGRKSRAGFSRRLPDGGFETADLVTGEYRPAQAPDLPGKGRDLDALISDGGPIGGYARSLLSNVIAYAAEHAPDIAEDTGAIDLAMQLGYGWKDGPFALADRVGADRIAGWVAAEGRAVPPLLSRAQGLGGFRKPVGQWLSTSAPDYALSRTTNPSLLDRARLACPPLWSNALAKVWDLGEGVGCFEAGSKMNSFDPVVFDLLETVLAQGTGRIRALVLGNDHPRAFSVGADLAFISVMIAQGRLADVDRYIERGQHLFLAMKRAPFPVVAAAHGFALGGGCEFTLHADAVVAHAELNMALPEVKVGLVPAWGGCTQLLLRSHQAAAAKGPVAAARPVFQTIFAGEFSTSAADAKGKGYLRPDAQVVMNRAGLLPEARHHALTLAEGYKPPEPALIQVAGPSGKSGLMVEMQARTAAGGLTETDLAMAETLAEVLTGGPSGDPLRPETEEAIMALERAALLELAKRPSTRARIDHMLATGRPLRN